MAQHLKPEVRQRILDAASRTFAQRGYAGASMAGIARKASLSTGNVYRYYANKDALFEAVLDEAFVARFDAVLASRLDSLANLERMNAPDAEASEAQQAFLGFLVDHRLQVVLLLSGCAGTRWEGYGAQFSETLASRFLTTLQGRGGAIAPTSRFVAHQLFAHTRDMLVAILAKYERAEDVAAAMASFWTYQLAGLAGFADGVTR